MGWLGDAAGAITGGLIGGGAAAGAQALQYKYLKREAKKNRKFQERMSSTAYQRGMKDMRKAGLNPILAYRQGGASSPHGSVAGVPDFTQSVAAGREGVTTAIQSKRVANELKLLENQVELTSAQTAKTQAEADAIRPEAAVKGAAGDALEQAIDKIKGWLGAETEVNSGKGTSMKRPIVEIFPESNKELEARAKALEEKGEYKRAANIRSFIRQGKKYGRQ